MSPSILDLFVLSQIDRGLETLYDLQRQAGVSLGSSVPAFRRLEAAGFIKKRETITASKRPRHSYQLSATGRRLARSGWIPLLKAQTPADLDAVLKLVDLANHYGADAVDIASFLVRASKDRGHLPNQPSAQKGKIGSTALPYVMSKKMWEADRLATEVKFLLGLAKSASAVGRKKLKVV